MRGCQAAQPLSGESVHVFSSRGLFLPWPWPCERSSRSSRRRMRQRGLSRLSPCIAAVLVLSSPVACFGPSIMVSRTGRTQWGRGSGNSGATLPSGRAQRGASRANCTPTRTHRHRRDMLRHTRACDVELHCASARARRGGGKHASRRPTQ